MQGRISQSYWVGTRPNRNRKDSITSWLPNPASLLMSHDPPEHHKESSKYHRWRQTNKKPGPSLVGVRGSVPSHASHWNNTTTTTNQPLEHCYCYYKPTIGKLFVNCSRAQRRPRRPARPGCSNGGESSDTHICYWSCLLAPFHSHIFYYQW